MCFGKDRDMKIVSQGMLLISGQIKAAYQEQKELAGNIEIVNNIAVVPEM